MDFINPRPIVAPSLHFCTIASHLWIYKLEFVDSMVHECIATVLSSLTWPDQFSFILGWEKGSGTPPIANAILASTLVQVSNNYC